MGKFADFAKVAIVQIFFRHLSDKGSQLRFIFGQDWAKQHLLAIFHFHPLFQLQRVRANSQSAFAITCKGRNIQCDIQRDKFIARRQQRMNIQPLNLSTIDDQVRDLDQKLAQPDNI
ncbi:hypothetical protein D3C72_548040 [compost metagenome]